MWQVHTEKLSWFSLFLTTFGTNDPKKIRLEKNLNYFKMTRYSQRFQGVKCSNTLKLYILKALGKNRFYFFFSSSDMQKIHHLLGCSAIDINSSSNFFFKFFAFSNLICQDFYRLQIKTISSTKMLYWPEKKLKQYAWKKGVLTREKIKTSLTKILLQKVINITAFI